MLMVKIKILSKTFGSRTEALETLLLALARFDPALFVHAGLVKER